MSYTPPEVFDPIYPYISNHSYPSYPPYPAYPAYPSQPTSNLLPSSVATGVEAYPVYDYPEYDYADYTAYDQSQLPVVEKGYQGYPQDDGTRDSNETCYTQQTTNDYSEYPLFDPHTYPALPLYKEPTAPSYPTYPPHQPLSNKHTYQPYQPHYPRPKRKFESTSNIDPTSQKLVRDGNGYSLNGFVAQRERDRDTRSVRDRERDATRGRDRDAREKRGCTDNTATCEASTQEDGNSWLSMLVDDEPDHASALPSLPPLLPTLPSTPLIATESTYPVFKSDLSQSDPRTLHDLFRQKSQFSQTEFFAHSDLNSHGQMERQADVRGAVGGYSAGYMKDYWGVDGGRREGRGSRESGVTRDTVRDAVTGKYDSVQDLPTILAAIPPPRVQHLNNPRNSNYRAIEKHADQAVDMQERQDKQEKQDKGDESEEEIEQEWKITFTRSSRTFKKGIGKFMHAVEVLRKNRNVRCRIFAE